MPSEFYVIKPRREVLANGVIVVAQTDHDSVLKIILEPLDSLEKHSDKKYSYWWKNKDDTFLIEKYYKSDYLCFSFPLSENVSSKTECHYDATLRLAFILQCEEGKMTYHFLGGFWKLPSKALEEEGTLNEKKISCCRPPFYKAVDPELLKEVNAQLERAMLLLYEMMLRVDLRSTFRSDIVEEMEFRKSSNIETSRDYRKIDNEVGLDKLCKDVKKRFY